MKYQAVYDKIIVERIKEEDESKTESGIILQNNTIVFGRGKILSKGEGTYQDGKRITMDVNVGDVVLYNPNMVSPLTTAIDNNIFIMSDKDVVAIERGE